MIANEPTRPSAPQHNATKPDGSDNGPRPKTLRLPTDLRWVEELRPKPRTQRWRWAIAGAGTTACAVLAAGLALTGPANAARLAPEGCMAVQIQPGDTVWAIARANGLTLDQISERNPHIDNLSRVHPGDEIVVSCDPADPVLAPPASVVNVDQWRGIEETPGVLSWESIVAELYLAGFRGEDLVTMTAIIPGESGRRPDAIGDTAIQNAAWGPSAGIAQIRTIRAQQGTGGPRDIDALTGSVAHQAWSAHEVFLAAGGFTPWTVFRTGGHLGWVDHARAVAASMGVMG